MLQGKTESGFEYELEEDVFDDWEIMECFRKIDKGNSEFIIDAAELLLGKEQYEKLKAFIKEKHGRVKATLMSEEIVNIFNSTKQGKNC